MAVSTSEFYYDATNSWSGYNYQGKTAIYVALKKINELIQANQADKISTYVLELEWLEDFSILAINDKGEMQYETIHQVKARADRNISDYASALTQLAKKVQSNCDIKCAYLHTINPLSYSKGTWEEAVGAVITTGKELESLLAQAKAYLGDQNELDELIKQVPHPTSFIRELQRVYMDEHPGVLLNKAKSTTRTMTEALQLLQKSLEENIEECKMGMPVASLKQIQRWNYDDGVTITDFCAQDHIEPLIKREILRYWELSSAPLWKLHETSDKSLSEQILLCLLSEIDHHVQARHINYGNNQDLHIALNSFIEILNRDDPETRCKEYYLYKTKHKILYHLNNYHERCWRGYEHSTQEAPCGSCQLHDTIAHIERCSFSDLNELIRTTNPDVYKELNINSLEDYCAASKYNDPFLKGLQKIKRPFDAGRIPISFVSDEKQLHLLTTLQNDGAPLPLETICNNIILNNDLPEIFMVYDVLISKDLNSDSLWKDAGDSMKEFQIEEDNIYHFKRIQIRSLDDSIPALN